MASSRPFVHSNNSLIPTPSPNQSRRSSVYAYNNISPSKSPNKKLAAKHHNRVVSLPDSPAKLTIPTFVLSPNRTPFTKPRASSISTPVPLRSKLPRPSMQAPTRQTGPFVPLEKSPRIVTTPTAPSNLVSKSSATALLPRSPQQLSATTVSPVHPQLKIAVPTLSPLLPVPEPRKVQVRLQQAPSALASAPQTFSKRDPARILNDLQTLIEASEVDLARTYLPLDVMMAIHERELMEGAVRVLRAKSIKGHSDRITGNGGPVGVFGFPLRQISLYASTKAILGGFEHDLPIVVFACVEELYRSGISTPSNPTPTSPSPDKFTRRTLSSSPLDLTTVQPRLAALLAIFDSPSLQHKFGINASLKDEASDDVYNLLTTFLSRLPEAVFAPSEILGGLRNAVWDWCVRPQTTTSSNAQCSFMHTRIRIAQLLLGLLPTPNLSLFVYLMAFACQVLEVRMRQRRRASAARDSLAGSISALEEQMLALERELEEKNEREKEKRKLGRAWGVWFFGRDQERGIEEGRNGDVAPEEDTRSTQMMVWFVSNWGSIIRGFFERGISVDLEPLSPRVGSIGLGLNTVPFPVYPHPLLNLATGGDCSFIDPVALSPNATPRQTSPRHPQEVNVRMSMVKGQSYGRPTSGPGSGSGMLVIPPCIPTEAGYSQEGSMHSRYSAYADRDAEESMDAGSLRADRMNESEMMRKDDSGWSQSSLFSALDERLLDLDLSDSDSLRFQIRKETAEDLASEKATSEVESLSSGSSSTSSEPTTPKLNFPVLRVVNRSDSDTGSSSSYSSAEFETRSEYSQSECPNVEEKEGRDVDEENIGLLMLTYSSSSSSSASSEVESSHDRFLTNRIRSVLLCEQCAQGCPAHEYVKELEGRLAALVKENSRMRLALRGT
ncbi:hypothetical protein BDP27DRAFT_1318982 [Rhodocollybia butyracea]|uniref:Rho-GAP domain-containing protein n=1 Tax=Rhodocollybia butyracea TaxID=206335 RepID=A0A9P5PVD6_9AGAR|nr:hypothetical protein BDP27DRAFT_1318982 [Rhodocollybia butyracea]